MKKKKEFDDELRPEYDLFKLKGGVWGKYVKRFKLGTNLVQLRKQFAPNKSGRISALEYARVSLARDLIRDRKRAGLSQQKLAELAGIRQETISRIETGKHTAAPKTVDKIMNVIETRRRRKGK
jgi:DNA-binding XRE family transcriptional regulator